MLDEQPQENPRIVGLDGPLAGEIVPLTASEEMAGRERTNGIHIPDVSVSRRHCRFRRFDNGDIQISDCNSRNGTFVNGVPVVEKMLEHGDELRLGRCRFVFLVRDEGAGMSSAVLSSAASFDTRTMIEMRREESVYLKPAEALESVTEPRRVMQSLKALLRISSAIRASRGLDELAGDLLNALSETIPASEGAVLLLEPGLDHPVWSYGWRRNTGPVRELPTPGDIVRRCCSEDIAILVNEPAASSTSGESGTDRPPRSVLAAPLVGSKGAVGAIYFGSTDSQVVFDEDQLQVLTATGSLSGMAIEHALQFERLAAENRRLREELDLDHDMVGDSTAMKAVYRFVGKVAPSDATVLIRGESGTGKELVARAIHRNSRRRSGPFVGVNCAALTETLLESELFGHEKGAFTDALRQTKGKFEAAHGGTLFLDEIGEMPAALQAKLLRVLQEREFERVGGTQPVKVDVRVITATNKDLRAEITGRRFREDLYYRLNVVSVRMPALRERKEDIPLLANYFLSRLGSKPGQKYGGLTAAIKARLMAYDWPGNVRELENAIERAVVLGAADELLPEDLPEEVLEAAPAEVETPGGYHEAVREAKRRIILQALEQANGSQVEAAKLLDVNPTYLSRLIRNLNLKDRTGRRS